MFFEDASDQRLQDSYFQTVDQAAEAKANAKLRQHITKPRTENKPWVPARSQTTYKRSAHKVSPARAQLPLTY